VGVDASWHRPTMIRVGTAGWSVPKALSTDFAGDGTHLARYGRVMHCAEIDSSFYRPHRRATYERWARETPDDFRFAVKLPRTITHDARLVDVREPLVAFLDQVAGLGAKLGVLLVQLPPSLAFVAEDATRFFELMRGLHAGPVVCEPRHATWFDDEADAAMRRLAIGRVAADPALSPRAAMPGGWMGTKGDGRGAVLYYRWHGSPRMYWSDYDAAWLAARATELRRWPVEADRWCIFDNTAAGAALANALTLKAMLDA
jgi:uncharacterized protein YecE (DUF72 family)